MNITFICDSYYPSKGGVQNVTKYLAEGLAKDKKNHVEILTLGNHEEEKINNVEVKRFKIKKNKIKRYYGEIRQLLDYVLNSNSDVTIFECAETITFTILLPYLTQIKGKKVLHTHGCYGLTIKPFEIKENLMKTFGNTFNYLYWNFYYYPLFVKKYVNNFDALISLHAKDSGLKFFNKNFMGKKYILGNAADDIFFSEDNKKYEEFNYITETGKYIINVSNYRNIKNQLGIIKQYNKEKRDYNMVFIGANKGKYYKLIKKNANKTNSGKIFVLNGIERKKIPYLMRKAEVYVIGSKYEEFSISLIEAMALGVPFVSTNVGNASELPGGEVVNNIKELNQTIESILQNKILHDKLSKEAKEYAYKNCKINQCVEKLYKIIKDV